MAKVIKIIKGDKIAAEFVSSSDTPNQLDERIAESFLEEAKNIALKRGAIQLYIEDGDKKKIVSIYNEANKAKNNMPPLFYDKVGIKLYNKSLFEIEALIKKFKISFKNRTEIKEESINKWIQKNLNR